MRFTSVGAFLCDSDSKESACNAGDLGLIPGLGCSPGEGNGNPLQYSCLENPMDRGAWQATVHRVTKSQTRLSELNINTHKCGCSVYYFLKFPVGFKHFKI